MNREIAVTYQMQLLIDAKTKPRARKVKLGSLQWREFQSVTIKDHTRLNIGDMQGDMI